MEYFILYGLFVIVWVILTVKILNKHIELMIYKTLNQLMGSLMIDIKKALDKNISESSDALKQSSSMVKPKPSIKKKVPKTSDPDKSRSKAIKKSK